MYKSDNRLHRSLDDQEELEFIRYANETCIRLIAEYKRQNPLIHPVCVFEMDQCIALIKSHFEDRPEQPIPELEYRQ